MYLFLFIKMKRHAGKRKTVAVAISEPSMGEVASACEPEAVIAVTFAKGLVRQFAKVTAATPSGASRDLPHRGGGSPRRSVSANLHA